MPKFAVSGVGRETGRKRRRVIEAKDEAEARARAEVGGTAVESIEQLPDEPATEAQLAYVQGLGLSIPAGATKQEASDVLTAHLERDKPADARHFAFADLYGVSYSRYTGKKSIYSRIFAALSAPGREQELAGWFVYRVYRAVVRDRDHASVSGPDHPIIHRAAAELATDEAVLKSIRRYDGTHLIWFGEWTTPDGTRLSGGSNQTIAYKRAAALLRELLPSEVHQSTLRSSAPPTKPASSTEAKSQRRGGCASTAGAVALGAIVLIGVLVWLNRLVA